MQRERKPGPVSQARIPGSLWPGPHWPGWPCSGSRWCASSGYWSGRTRNSIYCCMAYKPQHKANRKRPDDDRTDQIARQLELARGRPNKKKDLLCAGRIVCGEVDGDLSYGGPQRSKAPCTSADNVPKRHGATTNARPARDSQEINTGSKSAINGPDHRSQMSGERSGSQ